MIFCQRCAEQKISDIFLLLKKKKVELYQSANFAYIRLISTIPQDILNSGTLIFPQNALNQTSFPLLFHLQHMPVYDGPPGVVNHLRPVLLLKLLAVVALFLKKHYFFQIFREIKL